MMKPFAVGLCAALLSTPALAECGTYATGTGPEVMFPADGATVVVNFGDWSETCVLGENPHPVMTSEGLGFGSGWIEPQIATCEQFVTQVSWSTSNPDAPVDAPADLVTFYGQIFHRAC